MALLERNAVRSTAASLVLACWGVACSSAPPYFGWTPDQLFQHGQTAFEQGDFGEAQRAFERLVLTFPGYEQVVEARHYLARSFYADDEFLSAVSEFTRIVQVYPDHQRTSEAWMGLCRSYAAMSPHPQRDQQYTIQAQTTCQNVADDFRGTAVGDSARTVTSIMNSKLAQKTYEEAHFYFQRDIFESAELILLDLLEFYADSDVAAPAMARLIDIYTEWGWDEQRDDYRTRLLERHPDSPEARALAGEAAPDSTTIGNGRDLDDGLRARPPPS